MLFVGSTALPLMWMHTFFMRFPIDVIFLDRQGRILKIDHELKPWRLSSLAFGATEAIELPAGTAKRTNTQVGDVLTIQDD